LKEKIQKMYNEDDNLARKATPKEYPPVTLDNIEIDFKYILRITKVPTL